MQSYNLYKIRIILYKNIVEARTGGDASFNKKYKLYKKRPTRMEDKFDWLNWRKKREKYEMCRVGG